MTDNLIDLDSEHPAGPNPPPWEIYYINDDSEPNTGLLPEARTRGLNKYNGFDVQIRRTPPNLAAPILDRIGLWILENRKLRLGYEFRLFGTRYSVEPAIDSHGDPIYRLAWEGDPRPDDQTHRRLVRRFRSKSARLSQ